MLHNLASRYVWFYLPSFARRLTAHARLAEVVINPFLFINGDIQEEMELEVDVNFADEYFVLSLL